MVGNNEDRVYKCNNSIPRCLLTYVRIKPQFWRSGHLGKPSIGAVRIITHDLDRLFPESNGGKEKCRFQ